VTEASKVVVLAKSEVTVYSRKDSTSKLAKSAVSSVFDLPMGR